LRTKTDIIGICPQKRAFSGTKPQKGTIKKPPENLPSDLALPVISNQKMNHYLKDLGQIQMYVNYYDRICPLSSGQERTPRETATVDSGI